MAGMKFFGSAGAIGLFLGVALGAFAAHTLRGHLSGEMLDVFETGVRYQMYHSMALLVVAILSERGKWFKFGGFFYIAGIILFSGSLYALALTGHSAWGMITPAGGLSFMAGHVLIVWGFLKG